MSVVNRGARNIRDTAIAAATAYLSTPQGQQQAVQTAQAVGAGVKRNLEAAFREVKKMRAVKSSKNFNTMYPTNRRQQRGRGKGKKLRKNKKVKRPSRAFKSKVDAVLAAETPSGTMITRNAEAINVEFRNKQLDQVGFFSDGHDFNDFSYQRVFHAANVMYKNAASTKTGGNAATSNTLITPKFDYDTILHVENMYSTYRVRNTSPQVVIMKHYTCFPKTQEDATPNSTWATAIATAYPGSNLKVNNAQSGPTFLYDSPTKYPLFNAKWRVHVKTKTLKPGQMYTATRQGGKDVKYDLARSRNASGTDVFFANNPGKSQWSMFVYYTLPCQPSDRPAEALRAMPKHGDAFGTVIIEHDQYIRIRCPEETAIADRHNIMVRNEFAVNTTAGFLSHGLFVPNKAQIPV